MIVVFDAQCLLCDGWVRFLLRHDKRGVLRFASIQGDTGRMLLQKAGLQVDGLETLLLIDGDIGTDRDGAHVFMHTAAIFRVLHVLGWPWRLAWVFWLVPASLRDAAYRWLARNRYRWFGRSDACLMPQPGHAARFLD